jgi:hypothetical protein
VVAWSGGGDLNRTGASLRNSLTNSVDWEPQFHNHYGRSLAQLAR